MYRELISTPSAVPEAEALESIGRKHGVAPTTVHDAAEIVMQALSRNHWFASADAEIRHAADWTGEKQ